MLRAADPYYVKGSDTIPHSGAMAGIGANRCVVGVRPMILMWIACSAPWCDAAAQGNTPQVAIAAPRTWMAGERAGGRALVLNRAPDRAASCRSDTTPSPALPPSLAAAIDSIAREVAALRREVAELRARSDRGSLAALPSSASTPAAAPTSTQTAAPATAQPPAQTRPVESGFGSIRVAGLLQTWYTNGSLPGDNSLRIRRAELKLVGKVSPRVSWTLMIDPAKSLSLRQSTTTVAGQRVVVDESVNQSSRVLQDAYVSIALPRGFSVDVGQYKLPFAYEGPNPTSRVITVERPMFAADRGRGSLGDVRDIGATLRGKLLQRADLSVGFFDGSGEVMNAVDPNDQKVLVVNASTPVAWLKGLTLGASGVYGAAPNAEHARRDRLGGLLEFARGALTTRAEYIRGVDGDLHRLGYYGLVAYKLSSAFELVHRYDFFDPDVRRTASSSDDGATELLAGLNYYIAGHNAKLQLNGVERRWRHDLLPASRQLLLNVQTSW